LFYRPIELGVQSQWMMAQNQLPSIRRGMGQNLHGSARTTEALRRMIQHSQKSIRALARRYRINPGPTATWRRYPFDRACQRHRAEHRVTKPNHPWTNGEVERMNRTLNRQHLAYGHLTSFEIV
jgi:transposase InsO family protein